MTSPQVTIVIPVFNRSVLLKRCLDSVKAQTLRPLRVIVVDNNSTDGSLEAANDWKKQNGAPDFIVNVLTETAPGASAARNRGLREVTTPYTLFFDSDDEMYPTLVEKALGNIGTADLIYWQAEVVAIGGKRYKKPFHSPENLLKRHFYNSQLSTQQYMAKTELFRAVGGWNQEALVWNDWELGIRIVLNKPVAVALPEMLVTIHSQAESITGTKFAARKGEWEHTLGLAQKAIEEIASDGDDKKKLLRILAYRRANLAANYKKEGDHSSASLLLKKTLRESDLTPLDRLLLKLLYAYTAAGGRAAYYLWQ